MNDHPFESLPPAPDNLWPKISPRSPSNQSLLSEMLPASLLDVAGVVGRAVHLEMQSSGEYAAKAAMPTGRLRPHEIHLRRVELQFHSRLHAESAARLLNFYQVVHDQALGQGAASLPTPGQLKEAATRTYRMGLRDELALQHQIQVLKVEKPGFNDELFGQLKKNAFGHGAKHHR
jgi:hypothetical protein